MYIRVQRHNGEVCRRLDYQLRLSPLLCPSPLRATSTLRNEKSCPTLHIVPSLRSHHIRSPRDCE